MLNNLRRFSAFLDAERDALLVAAQRARALDHMTNRGTDYERSVRAWVRSFVEPEYTVSEGEIIDSFNTNPDKDSRQRDAILHKDTRRARRFTFGDGMRLVPIESVALLLEVKLTIDSDKFKLADVAAQEANELRLAVDRITRPVNHNAELGFDIVEEGRVYGPKEGTRVADAYKRVWYGIIAASGPEVETLAGWLRAGTTIDFVSCLSTGCAFRPPWARRREVHPAMATCDVSPADRSLTHLGTLIHLALNNFEDHDRNTVPDYSRYEPYMSVRYYDDLGYELPAGVSRLPDELAELERMGKVPKGTTESR
jgi:hypothetical protein